MEPIKPFNDQRVSHHYTELNGYKYHYLLGIPENGKFSRTVFLIHGWPDISMGWRFQIPMFLEKGYRVVAPDMMGFGGTDAPKVPPAPLNVYGWKQAADNIAELAKQLGCKTIVLGGHDWGGPVVYRTCLWHPTLVSHVFSVCTPYKPSAEQFVPLPTLVAGLVPQFGYQLQFAGQDVEAAVQSEGDIRRLLSAIYGGPTPDGECIFDPRKGVDIAKLPSVGEAPLLKGEDLDYYTREFSRNGVRGGLNWYRTYQANWEDEVGLEKKTIDIPCLFVLASRDTVLTKDLSEGMEDFIPLLTRKEIDAGHFVLVEKPHEVNIALQEWLEQYGI